MTLQRISAVRDHGRPSPQREGDREFDLRTLAGVTNLQVGAEFLGTRLHIPNTAAAGGRIRSQAAAVIVDANMQTTRG